MAARILVVDNEIDELAGWETALTRAGYSVQTASTPARALELCDESMFDLVMLDFVMPNMKGLELLARIRQKIPLVRSILISGKLNKDLSEQQVKDEIRGEVETDRYIHKPVKNEDLLAAVSEVLKNAPAGTWESVASQYLEGGKGSVSRAKDAQNKLKKHIDKKS